MPEERRTSVLVQIFKNRVDLYSSSNYTGIKIIQQYRCEVCFESVDGEKVTRYCVLVDLGVVGVTNGYLCKE